MATVKDPTTLADHLGIPPARFAELGVLNPTLGIDVKLFIDPLLLPVSAHVEINRDAVRQYRDHFTTVIKLLAASTRVDDVPWRSAKRLFQFHELRATCLGYGTGSIYGSGFGDELIGSVMRTAKEIVDLGVRDPDLFPAMALFEENVGPDRISDMTTNVILESLIAFSSRVLGQLGVQTENFDILGKQGRLLRNPLQSKRTPLILAPRDILRELPTAMDWDSVCAAAAHNEALRARVNRHIAHIWEARAKRDKQDLRAQALRSRDAFQAVLDAIHRVELRPYDLRTDPEGLVRWVEAGRAFAEQFPLLLVTPKPLSLDGVHQVAQQITKQFQHLVERCGLWQSLWHQRKPLHEKYAQRLFFTLSYAYCKANNVDISPELDAGSGRVDFKFAGGFDSRVLVEIKLSHNRKLLAGYQRQLETYKASQETMRAIYVVVDVGGLGRKDQQLVELRNEATGRGEPLSDLEFIDGRRQPPASRL